jgi:hypothetical protein
MIQALFTNVLFSFLILLQEKPVDPILERHFLAHDQSDWNQFESLTAKGEWHIGSKTIYVDYLISKPHKLAAVSRNTREKLVTNELYAGMRGEDELTRKGIAFDLNEAISLSYAWSFGSPLFDDQEDLIRKEDVSVDQIPCYWYQRPEGRFTYDYFIRKSDNLHHKVTVSALDGRTVGTVTVEQYRKLGLFYMPSQVRIKTSKIDFLLVFTEYLIGDYVRPDSFNLDP